MSGARKTDSDGFTLTALKLREADVLKAVTDMMRAHGWLVRRTFPGRWVPYYEYVNAGKMTRRVVPRKLHPTNDPDLLCVHPRHGALWIEVKAPGGKPKPAQQVQLDVLRRDGYRVWWVDCIEMAKMYYNRAFA